MKLITMLYDISDTVQDRVRLVPFPAYYYRIAISSDIVIVLVES